MSRFRITVRGDNPAVELRGYVDGDMYRLAELADALAPFGLVVASEASDNYDPFASRST